MPLRDVFVEITRNTRPPTRAGFGLPLILTEATGGGNYTTYRGLDQVETDYADTTDAYRMAAQIWAQDPQVERVAIAAVDSTTTPTASDYETMLDALVLEDWYFLLLTTEDAPITTAVSNYINGVGATQEERIKLLFVRQESTTLASALGDQDRTAAFYLVDAGHFPEAAWVGKCAPALPGSQTWKFKTLESALPLAVPEPFEPVSISTNNLADLHDPNEGNGSQNTYVSKMGYLQTSEGLVTSGEYIDVMRGLDFVRIRIEEGITRLLAETPKVPMTNPGIAMVLAEVEAVMQVATQQGIIATDGDGNGIWAVTGPTRDEVSESDRAARTLRDVEFTLELAGAVHVVYVSGVVRV